MYAASVKRGLKDMSYEYLDVKGDMGFVARGRSIEDLFKAAALAMYNAMVDISKVKRSVSKEVEVSASDLDILLHHWLQELLFITDTEGIVFSSFDVEICKDDEFRAKGRAYGEKLNPELHEIRTAIKAVTYHNLELRTEDDGWRATVILDV
ncbi:MAG: archease [Candidatus Methanodesulfokora sp.]|nr:MAG: archease [Candidatus Korarchaeota archaeon]